MPGRPREFDTNVALEKAMLVFWKKGFTETSLADLEQATGAGRQSLYAAFGDKHALFSQVVEFYFVRVLQPMVDLLDAPGSGRGNIDRLLQSWEDYVCSPLFQGCLVDRAIDSAASDERMNAFLSRKLTFLENALERALRRAVEAGEVSSSVQPRATARVLLTLSQGLSVMARVNQERSYVRSVLDVARALLG
jgi:TetR/AcrR family transcriptional repressor of nem operon